MSLPVDKALRKAQSHIKVGELAEAEELYKQILSKFPKNKKAIQAYQKLKTGITSKGPLNSETPQEQIDELTSLYDQGQFDEILSKAKPLSGLFPKDELLFSIMGAANAALFRYDAAVECYTESIKIKPNYTDAYYNMGKALQDQGDVDAALEIYDKAIKINPNYADAYNNIGTIFYKKDEFDQAISYISSALKINPNDADAYTNMGNALRDKGDLDAAIDSYEQAIKIKPDYAEAYSNMGVALKDQGDLDAAIDSYKQAIKIKPDYAGAYSNMGNALQKKGELDAAIDSCKQAIKIKPDYADAYSNMGIALKDKGESDAAIDSYKQAIKIKPDYADAYRNMGIALKDKGESDAAIDSYKQAIKIKPDYAEAYSNMGISLKDKGELDAAIDSYKQAIKIKPDYAEAYSNMGVALKDQGELDAAIDSCKQAIKIKPDYADAYSNMGVALKDKGELDAAIDSYKQAIKIKPDYADAYSNMGIALQDKGELDAAIGSYKQAIKIKPDYAEMHHNLSFAFLNAGGLKEGLDKYEWRWKTAENLSKMRHFSKPLWDGITSLKDKTILLWGEQGPGDVIMWSSCLSLVASQAEKCILECEEKLVPLLARSFPKVEVRAENRSLDNHRDDFDVHLPMGSLFRHFIPEISKKTKPNAFLIPDPVRVNFWKERLNLLGNGPFVGISWKSPLVTPARLPNYTRIPDWAPVLALSDVTFVNLQSSEFKDDLAEIWDEFGVNVHNFDDLDHYNDLDDVAALSASFDVVISVSTAVSTIAAGVGTPTKMLHWRQSSWNNILFTPPGPSVDVFERNTWEPWDDVFQSVAKDIADFQVA